MASTDATTTPFDLLSNEIHINILDFVGFPGILGYYSTSKSTYDVCQSDYLWNLLYKRDLPMFPRRSESAKTDYLRTYRIVHEFADNFVIKFSRGNLRYIKLEVQVKDVVDLITNYFKELSPATLGNWQGFANLTQEEFKKETNDGIIHDYNDELGGDVDSLTGKLLSIMLAVDNDILRMIHEDELFDVTIEYMSEILELIKGLLTTRTSEAQSHIARA